jgi:hypothetical protein
MKIQSLFEQRILAKIKEYKDPTKNRGFNLINHDGKEWAFTGKTGTTNFSQKKAFEYQHDYPKGEHDRVWITIDGEIYKD